MRQLRILHVVGTLDVGGAERQLLELVKIQRKQGHEVVVAPLVGANSLAEKFTSEGILVKNEISNRNPFVQVCFLRRILRENGIDVLHAHLSRAEVLSALIRKRDIFFVLTRHDAMKVYRSLPRLVAKPLWRWVHSRADGIIVISSWIKKEILRRKEILDLEKTFVIPYGISANSHDPFNQLRDPKVNEFALGKLVIGAVGRLVKEKNYPLLLSAFAVIQREYINARLLIFGSGPLRRDLDRQIFNMGIGGYVKIVENVTIDFRHYGIIDIFVLSSTTEGFGLVLLEAMAARVPIVASNLETSSEILGQECGILFESDKQDSLVLALRTMLSDNQREKYALKASKRIKDFEITKVSTKILEVYRSK